MRTVLLLLADYRVQDARIAPLDSAWEYPAMTGWRWTSCSAARGARSPPPRRTDGSRVTPSRSAALCRL
jgi:hypothetical protein